MGRGLEPTLNWGGQARKLWVSFGDGVEGEADLADIAGRGVSIRWSEHPEEFSQVAVDGQTDDLRGTPPPPRSP